MLASILTVLLGVTFAQAETINFDTLSLPQRQYVVSQLIDSYGDHYGLSDNKKMQMYKTVGCETSQTYLAGIKSGYYHENSWGLSQINLPSHPQVAKSDATNPDFAIQFMAEHFAMDDENIWTCWRNLYE